jgi:P22 coat protein - gene protein 5
MANTIITISMITREAIELFVNSNAFIKNIDRQFDDEFGRSGNKIGSQLRIRLPNDFVVVSGPGVSVQDTAEQQTVLTMATQQHVDVSFSQADLLLALDDFSERILLPMMNNLAGNVAQTVMTNTEGAICNIQANLDAGGNIQSPNAGTYLQARARLNDNSAPMPARKVINDPWTEARVVQSLAGLLNPNTAISEQYYEGVMYRALGFTWFMDQTVIKHTTGTFSAGTVNGANQTGTTLVTNATTGTLVAGDIITIAGVNAVNRVTKQSTGMLRQFVVTVAAATSATSLTLYPSLIPAGVGGVQVQYQTVVASPANGAAISLYTLASVTWRRNFAYAPQMITMATGDLPIPANLQQSARHRYDNVSMRSLTQYQIGTDQEITRLDVLFGSLSVRPEWGCLVPDLI